MLSEAIQKQLDEWLKTNPPPKPQLHHAPPPLKLPNPLRGKAEHDLVAGGIVRWTPVDRLAANVFRKAGWLEQPPPPPKSPPAPPPPKPPEPPKVEHRKKVRKAMSSSNVSFPNPPSSKVRTSIVDGETYFNLEDINQSIIEQINKQPKELTQLARASIDARTVLNENMQGLGGLMEQFDANVKVHLDNIRQTRFAIVSELAQMSAAIKDVRQFFLGPNYETEIKRLKEFVEICERLKVLKDSGFLDNVADTMIRLAK